MDPDLMGRDAGEVNTGVDHILLPSDAATEGMPYSEERLEREDHGKGDSEHLLAHPNITPHDIMEHQKRTEDAD